MPIHVGLTDSLEFTRLISVECLLHRARCTHTDLDSRYPECLKSLRPHVAGYDHLRSELGDTLRCLNPRALGRIDVLLV